jgi:F-type H+-transporting ATPase subunit b
VVQSISIQFVGLPTAETEQAPPPISAVPTAETTAEAPKQPDNPILPTGQELLWGAVTFTLLWILMKFVLLKPIQKTMADRADKVRGDVADAEAARASALSALAEYEASLASARVEAGRIIDDGRAQAEAKRKEIIAEAEAEVAELRAAATAEVNDAKSVAMTSMRSSVATIAVQAAEAVVQKRLDENAMRSIVDDYLNRVGSQN